ncbi:CBM21 domain-containing protein [Niveibacterium sp. 24ML]|uniref:carbohydrate-binding protein n=1 Tax=Niveibacterium sp. 24ML TaxID=2985512 RepID=UPI0022701E23|nr:carbohydrate-binding protein [Niveibacterium sp. 24ML]MCX9155507.1 CBM21 domain-containing protein [Niveibacterium sp. 24ML]
MRRIILALLLLVSAGIASAADEVRLLRSQSTVSAYYQVGLQSVRFEALVKNMAYAKEVYVHLKKPDGSWIDVPLAYSRPADNGREVWAANYQDSTETGPIYQSWDLEFALRYKVNGQEYWDNNGGANYKQAKDSGSLMPQAPVLARYVDTGNPVVVYGNRYYGSVSVKTLGANRQAEIRYTTDGWKTSKTAWAVWNGDFWRSYYSSATNPNQYGVEELAFGLQLAPGATRIEYAVGYTVDGKTYWDNNYGRNYSVAVQQN